MPESIEESRSAKHPGSIAVVNYKGGVGKTTVTYLVGLYTALRTGRRVLLIDIDAQCSLTFAVGFEPGEILVSKQNVYQLVKPSTWSKITELRPKNFTQPIPGLLNAPLYILPGAFEVEDLDIEITEAIHDERQRSKSEFFLFCRQLINALKDFDYVFIDTPPNKMYLTQAMLRASEFFIPVTIPDGISVYGMPRLLRWITAIPQMERPKLLGYVLNSTNRSGGSPTGKVISQQAAVAELDHQLLERLSYDELEKINNRLCMGEIPRLDQIAQFMGANKEVRLDFARHTSGQPTVDRCLNSIVKEALDRIENFRAEI